MPDPTAHLLATAFAFLLAGFVKGMIGMGLPTVSVGVLSIVMPPAQAAALVVAPSLVTNVWQSIAGPSLGPLLRRLWSMLTGVALGIWFGASLLTGNTKAATIALGVLLIVYSVLGLFAVRIAVSKSAEPWLSPFIGVITGLVTGATGIFVIPAVPYLQALEMHRDDLVQALGLSFMISTIVLAIVLARAGIFHLSVAGCLFWPSHRPSPACTSGGWCARACARRCSGSASCSACWV